MKKYIVYAVLCSLLLVLCGCGEQPDMILKGQQSEAVSEEISVSDRECVKETQEVLSAYICGAVKNPGVYELAVGSRICQLVEKAGGMTKKADRAGVNLAEKLTDGQMVQIPELSAADDTKAGGGQRQAEGFSADGKVNINTASLDQLMTLTGIGQTKAEKILAYREKNGSFTKIEDIMQVAGIKEGTYEKIKESISVR